MIAGERLPWAPFETVLGGLEANREPCGHRPKRLARVLHVDPALIYRWRREGLTVPMADRLCMQIGRHSAEVWAEWAPCETVAS